MASCRSKGQVLADAKDQRATTAFVLCHVLTAIAVGAAGGSMLLKWQAVVMFAALLGGCAGVAVLICSWWPGFAAPSWKLWLAATLGNPVLLAAISWSLVQWECLVGGKTGWDCMFAAVGPLAVAVCLPSPVVAAAAHWWFRRRSPR